MKTRRSTQTAILAAAVMALAVQVRAELVVTKVDAPPTGDAVFLKREEQDNSGVTSVRFTRAEDKRKQEPVAGVPEGKAYFSRDRDLGQVFTMPKGPARRLDAITLKTGPVKGKVLAGARGAAVSVQFFKVTGEVVVNDNGTTKGKVVEWNSDPRADDYITGETYTSLRVARGGKLPADLDANQYMRWEFRGDDRIVLEPGAKYAFLLMLDSPAKDAAFTLANKYSFKYDPKEGHGIRREGSVAEPWKDKDAVWTKLENCCLPAEFEKRIALPPGTWGRPDVDTWRWLVMYLEGAEIKR